MTPIIMLSVYCLLILLASLAGGVIPLWIRLTHQRMELAVSLVAGFMLGVGMLHLLPHAIVEVGSVHPVVMWVLAGFLVMFFLERFFCFHHHDVPDLAPEDCPGDPHHGHNHPEHKPHHGHELTWGGAAVGLTLHSVIAGAGLAASIKNELDAPHGTLAGLAVFLMIFLHKPFDSLSLATLMSAGGWSTRSRHVVNALFALAVPLGAVLFHLGHEAMTHHGQPTIGYALAFATGMFLCISMSDLLPELQFHQHDRFKLSAMLVMGLALAWAISWFETGAHDHASPHNVPVNKPLEHDPHHDHHH